METIATRLQDAERKVRILQEITTFVSSLLYLQHILDAAVGLLMEEFGLHACSIRLLDEEGNLSIRSHAGLSAAFVKHASRKPTVESYSGECFLTGNVVIVNDSDDMDKPISTARTVCEDIKSFALAPIIVEGKTIGVLVTASRQRGYFPELFKDVIATVARQIGVAIRISQLYEEIDVLNQNLEKKVRERSLELERKTRELIEAERLAIIGELSQKIAHDCRNSLTVVGGLARRLDNRTPREDPRKEYTRIIVEEVKNLEQKISTIIHTDKTGS
jgi:sigma-B regulation protein RsbU (phosphoserine phosphatase)